MKKPKSARQDQILTELGRAPSLRVAELARRLSVSTETIRRDLDEMTGQGLLNRTYGGAVRPLGSEPAVTERHQLFVAERERIARTAVDLVRDARVLMIGSGSTTVHVARRIAAEMRDVTILTHSFGVATVLSANPTLRVILLPGDYLGAEGATAGVHAVSFLAGYYADVSIIGASGLSDDGPSEALIECGAVYSTMVARSASTLVVADRSKHDRIFTARYAGWRDVSHLVTDKSPAGSLGEALARAGVVVTLA